MTRRNSSVVAMRSHWLHLQARSWRALARVESNTDFGFAAPVLKALLSLESTHRQRQ